VVVMDIPAGTFIPAYGVAIQILTAFAGGTPSLDVGDGDDPDGWVDSLDITEGTEATYTGGATNSDLADSGKYYAADGQLAVVVSASLTAGKAYVLAHLIDMSDLMDD
jgi:hypothetical protein